MLSRLDLQSRQVMAIINVTPDSFHAASRARNENEVVTAAHKALLEGASILDIGGYSTRPGHGQVSPEEEFSRLNAALRAIRREFPETSLSVDTFRSEVVERLYDIHGEFIVNDISASDRDVRMLPLVARLDLPYVAMHSCPNEQVVGYFRSKIELFRRHGITKIVLDPGFGFAKDVSENFRVLQNLSELTQFGFPILAGISRKSMIWRTLDISPAEALNGTTALHWECLRQGSSILRVHDVKEAVEVIKLFHTFVAKS